MKELAVMGWRSITALVWTILLSVPAHAETPVGEMHRVVESSGAAQRDSAGRSDLRLTIWYPAIADAVERPVVIGPAENPLFVVGMAAQDARVAAGSGKRPLILLSHGFGGTARVMGWFGIAMARQGYVVVAVDHPGNNGADPMTVAGGLLTWERASDLKQALSGAIADPVIGPHIDPKRVGLAGFSAGGYAVLIAAGGRPDPMRLRRFCAVNPKDGVCAPQIEFEIDANQRDAFIADPRNAAILRRVGDDRTIPQIRAVFAMAPAVVQGIDPESLRAIRVPTRIIAGDADTVAPPRTNAEAAKREVPGSRLQILSGVTHYDFLATCAPGSTLPVCRQAQNQKVAHRSAIAAATQLFAEALGRAADDR